jgi:pimeloyl-ACP methyl ester carboxylesterase
MNKNKAYQERYVRSDNGLKLYYREYDCDYPYETPMLCLHGLTRNCKDFDKFARHFSADRRVITMDMRGRGQSQYDPDYENYQIPVYAQDILSLVKYEELDKIITVGTSMGGLISMTLASVKPDLFEAIILNDIGPEIDPKGLERISGYVGNGVKLRDWDEAISVVKAISGHLFPDYNDKDWEDFTHNSFRRHRNGLITADYDQAIGTALREIKEEVMPVDFWGLFSDISQIPVMTLRGEHSDILSSETLDRMAKEHPNFTKVTVPDRGHTPDLTEAVSLKEIKAFLDQL